MKNIKPFIKRVSAYLIDMIIVLMLASAISSIPVINKNMDEYQNTYNEYESKYNEYSNYLTQLEKSYEDKEINEEEYNTLTENEYYKEIIINKYEDNKISKGEYKKITTEINDKFNNEAQNYIYILNKKSISNTIITLVTTLLYFGILQYILKGQTIGKKIMKLKITSATDKKINIINYILRSLVINNIFLNTIILIFLYTANKTMYLSANDIISTIVSIIQAITIYLVLTRDDGRGLHDILFNTKVVFEEPLSKEYIEADYEEKN